MIKLILAFTFSGIFILFVVQNLQTVELNFLFWQFNGSLALILILTFAIAIMVSILVSIPLMLKNWKNKNKNKEAPADKKPPN